MPKPVLRPADLRGAARLVTEATAGLADLVEAVHGRIARVPGLAGAPDGRTQGITGLVYWTVRGVTRVVGGSVDALLALLTPALTVDAAGEPVQAEREAVVAALNGVLGDHLAATANPLATAMAFRHDGRELPLDADGLRERLPQISGHPLVLLHGLCLNDLQWRREGHDHGAALAREFGYTPVYLHYNSGLPIATNGGQLATLMERLLAAWPVAVERLVLLGHSMGGLVARSAVHQAASAGLAWPAQLKDMVFLGTPHHGAPLERAGQGLATLLAALPHAAPLARLARLRSAGITDLRHGLPQALALPPGVRSAAIAASTGQQGGDLKDRLLGDGLVPLDSALGRHTDPARTLAFMPERQWTCFGMNHMELLSRPEVMAPLRQWLGDAVRA